MIVSRCQAKDLLGGSGVVISGVISPPIWAISILTVLMTLLISSHEPPSKIKTNLNPPEPTFLSGPYKLHIRVYNKNRQKVGFGRLRNTPKP